MAAAIVVEVAPLEKRPSLFFLLPTKALVEEVLKLLIAKKKKKGQKTSKK